MEIQKSGLSEDSREPRLSPSLFVHTVVGFEDGQFRRLRPASGPSGPEDLVDVLARTLDLLKTGILPPVFDHQQPLS